ncbi:UpxY family transcription antiterminator [bacterium]|nr:UpxY family transcription antiterminator [bacterium]
MPNEWFAVYTRPRHEKKVAEQLTNKGIQVFLPLRTVISHWKDRRKEVQFPLFTGYVFVHIVLEDRLSVLRIPGVVQFVASEGKPAAIPDSQIDAVRQLVNSGLKYDPYPYVKEGMRVTIRNGPLKGVEGLVLAKRKKHLLVLSVDIIQQSASLEIDINDTDVR